MESGFSQLCSRQIAIYLGCQMKSTSETRAARMLMLEVLHGIIKSAL